MCAGKGERKKRSAIEIDITQ